MRTHQLWVGIVMAVIGTVLSPINGKAVSSYHWRTDGGQILYTIGLPPMPSEQDTGWSLTHLSGASWFGFETQDFVVNGLWAHPLDFYITVLKTLGVNILRIPFSSEWMLFNRDIYPYDEFVSGDPSAAGKTSLEILDQLFEKTASHGIGVMLDLHRLHKEYISELWYSPTDNQYTGDTFFTTWYSILDHVLLDKKFNNLIAIDLLNEPHGAATWGSDDPSTDWRLFVEYVIPTLADRYSNHSFLFFVEGIEWGHTFRDWNNRQAPIRLPTDLLHRTVFSPHTYGKSVVASTSDRYEDLVYTWDTDFGFLRDLGHAVVVGEWGGITSLDANWMSSLVTYLTRKNMTNQFFWSLGPNSGDVRGILLDDWTRIDTFKQGIMQQLVSSPTLFRFT